MSKRVGVLLLDSLREPFRSIAGDYDALFTELFTMDGLDVAVYDGRAELPDHGECDGWVLGGSPASVDDELDWIPPLERWTRESLDRRVPLAGVCFGHQLVARVAGAPVVRWEGGWNVGAIDYDVRNEPSWIGAMPERFRLLASHQDQVVELPAGADLLASAPGCPIAGYTIDDHVICVQGHPEFVPPLAAALYRSRVEQIGRARVEQAIDTLDRPLDRDLVAAWLVAAISRTSVEPSR